MGKKKYRPKKKVKMKKFFLFTKIFFFILFIIFVLYMSESIKPQQQVRIEHGGITKVVDGLERQGYDIGLIDKYIIAIFGNPKAGIICFDKNATLSRLKFLYDVANKKSIGIDNQITLIPGETLENFFSDIAQKMDMNEDILMDEYKKQSYYEEAGIMPDTYFTNTNMHEKQLIEFMIKPTEEKYSKMAIEHFGIYDKQKWQDILIKASIIQKEAANKDEMPIISSVIDNRLSKHMKLQMDGSLNYGKFSHIAVTPERIKNDNSSFNTYKNYGLPESPVGSVSKDAIEAAINPSKTNYLYFVKNKNGVHTFTSDFKSHRDAIEKNR